MKSPLLISLLALLCTVAACADVPTVNYDVLRAQDTQNPQNHLDLLRQQGEHIAGTKFVGGNKVELLHDGSGAYPAMFKAIAGAHHRIDMESYEFDDGAGKRFAAALLKRSRAGIEVNLIYDSWGSSDTSNTLFDQLRAGGVHVVEYNPIDPTAFLDLSVNDRDHRKLLIVDEKTAFVGGVNVSHVYKMKLKRVLKIPPSQEDIDIDKLAWRDTQVKIEGPVVGEFERIYMQTWHDQHGDPIPNPRPTTKTQRGDLMVQAIEGTPGIDRYAIYRSLVMAISLAQSSVHLTTGYFVPTADLLNALKQAAQRGVDVTLILPSQSDSDLALSAGHATYGDLLDAGVKIYERQGVVLHAKTAVIDGMWSTVGSSNLDWRSVLFNNECNAMILGKKFGVQMESMFADDLSQSRRITRQDWGQRPFFDAVHEWKARLVEDLL